MTPALRRTLEDLLRRGFVVQAIARYRAATGADLSTAKAAVNGLGVRPAVPSLDSIWMTPELTRFFAIPPLRALEPGPLRLVDAHGSTRAAAERAVEGFAIPESLARPVLEAALRSAGNPEDAGAAYREIEPRARRWFRAARAEEIRAAAVAHAAMQVQQHAVGAEHDFAALVSAGVWHTPPDFTLAGLLRALFPGLLLVPGGRTMTSDAMFAEVERAVTLTDVNVDVRHVGADEGPVRERLAGLRRAIEGIVNPGRTVVYRVNADALPGYTAVYWSFAFALHDPVARRAVWLRGAASD